MAPNQSCNIWDHNGNAVAVMVITLTVWNAGMKAARKGLDIKGIEQVVREALSCPPSYPTEALADHIQDSLTDVQQQLRDAGIIK